MTGEPETNADGDAVADPNSSAAGEHGASEASPATNDNAGSSAAVSTSAEMASAAHQPEPDEPEEEEYSGPVEPLEFVDESLDDANAERNWYILKVAVNREESIKDALIRRLKREGLDRYFGEVVIPTEDVIEFTKSQKKKIVKKKLYPGYLLVSMHINDATWFVVRETPGIGDFTSAGGKPAPMAQRDVDKILKVAKPVEEDAQQAKMAIPFKKGDRVRVKEGYFQNSEGEVEAIDESNGRVTVLLTVFGRNTPVELSHWQIEAV